MGKVDDMPKRIMFGFLLLAALSAIVATPAFARTPRVLDDNDTVTLPGNVHPHARPEFDRGATDPSLPMERMILTLRRPSDKEAQLESLLSKQQDPSSSNFHQWLTPEEFGERFGTEKEDIETITGWLSSHGFSVEEVSRSRSSIIFSGSVSQVERAFHTSIHDYFVDGQLRRANSRDPALPRGLADLAKGIVSLHNFPRKAMHGGIRPISQGDIQPSDTAGGGHSLSPGDFATIYNLTPLYAAGIDGSGQSIAIAGRTHPSSSNWCSFRGNMGLPAKTVQVTVYGADPGDLGADQDGEADLDVEWSGAVAKNATVRFVIAKSTAATDGIDLAAQYIVNNNLAPVMSTSFGQCESIMGAAENSFYSNLWQQAAAQGISSFVASGDSGAAGCSSPGAGSGFGLGVNGLASTPYNVAVGGTQFNDGAGGYWNTSNGPWYSSATGYIPETAWNESYNVSGGSGLWAGGGGVSLYYAKPSWQVAPGVPAGGKRSVPDVSLNAAGHVGYLVQTQGAFWSMSGTSASSPAFAGLMALVVQKTGQRQGNANIRFYQLANAQFGSGGAAVFHDTISGNNSVPGVAGYSCTAGYDMATGLGSVDATVLVNNWGLGVTSYTLSYTAGANGSISGISPQTVNPGGSGTKVTALANPGYHFDFWSDGVTSAARIETVVTGSISVTASFAANSYTLSYAAGANGSISGISPQTVNSGGSGTQVTALANPGYHFVSWSDGVTSAARTETNVTGGMSVTASFAVNSYTLTFSAGLNGSLAGSTMQSVNYSDSASAVSALPAAGYHFANWTGTGGFVASTANPLLVANVTATESITANFVLIDGILSPAPGKVQPDLGDVLRVLRIVTGELSATASDLTHADIAPLGINNKPKGDGRIDIYDVIGILRMTVGLI
jgi:subtilase family serine protease